MAMAGCFKANIMYRVINNYSTLYMANNDQKPIVSLKSPIHEMGHIFGLLDLYNSSGQTPVYFMSAMANAISPVPQGTFDQRKRGSGMDRRQYSKDDHRTG